MYLKFLNWSVARWIGCEKGATAIEYGLIAAGISLAIVASVFAFGDDLEAIFPAIQAPLDNIAAEAETSR